MPWCCRSSSLPPRPPLDEICAAASRPVKIAGNPDEEAAPGASSHDAFAEALLDAASAQRRRKRLAELTGISFSAFACHCSQSKYSCFAQPIFSLLRKTILLCRAAAPLRATKSEAEPNALPYQQPFPEGPFFSCGGSPNLPNKRSDTCLPELMRL